MAGLEGTKTDRQALTGDISVKPGIDGKSVTIVKITESTEDGGNNIVEFSDGSRLKIKNGSGGKIGIDGKSAYQYAQDGGYTGTEEEFALLMSQENLQTEKVDKISIEVSKLSEDIADIKQNGTGTGNGATTAQANSLWVIIQKSAFAQQLTDAEINAFKTAWGIGGEVEPDIPDEPTEPDNPEVTLTSISATYTGGNVTVGTSVTDLTGITVTGTYSDGSTSTITGYTLSGEIVEGSNTITVSYSDKTTTFTVVGVAEEEPDEPVELRGYQFTEFANVYGDRDNYIQWKWNVGISNRFTFTERLFPSGEYWIRYLMYSDSSGEGYAPLMYQTSDANWLTTKSETPTAITKDQFWSCKLLGDDNSSTAMIVSADGQHSFVANSSNDGTEMYVYLVKITVPEGYYGVLALGSGTSNNTKVAYVENWVTAFYEDPTNNITCTEVTE